ncbi:P-loop containing nucleoside triphosphate hydrolase protein [Chytridium lagenaria]|nr:P-loop containing nucleoside triphosphate hydrolase protein [Chytridium lagenaria]
MSNSTSTINNLPTSLSPSPVPHHEHITIREPDTKKDGADIHIHVEHEHAQLTVRSMKEFQNFIATKNHDTIELAWRDLTVTTKDGEKVLLKPISGAVSGKFLAIMGPSGSGKTTMMNTLAYRQKNVVSNGITTINGNDYTMSELKMISGYVMQDDLLNAHLTVEETLMYTAELRMPSKTTAEDRKLKVDEVIQTLGIGHCRKTIIGDHLKRGISGGERKRVCVAMELLTDPCLLFLDEPTSGLDSMTSLSLCKTLKRLAKERGCTVITTIHQPQTKIFSLFDDILLLNKGTVVYYGPVAEIYDFFAHAGHPCPPHTNFADHMLDVIIGEASLAETRPPSVLGVTTVGDQSAASRRLEALYHEHEKSKLDMLATKAETNTVSKLDSRLVMHRKPTWWRQFVVLTRRCFKEQFRSYSVIITQIVQSVIMGVLIGAVFLRIGNTQSSIVRRQPVLFFCVVNQGVFGSLTMINSFPSERLLVLRERAAGTYRVSAYFLAKNLSETAIQLISPVLFSIVVYPMVGLQGDVGKFLVFLVILHGPLRHRRKLCRLFISAVCRTTTLSITVLPLIFELHRLFGGFFLSPANLPIHFSFLDGISYVKYAYVGIALNELSGLKLVCSPSELRADGTCPITDGQFTISQLGLDKMTMWVAPVR